MVLIYLLRRKLEDTFLLADLEFMSVNIDGFYILDIMLKIVR